MRVERLIVTMCAKELLLDGEAYVVALIVEAPFGIFENLSISYISETPTYFPVLIVSIETKTHLVRSPENIKLKNLTGITYTEINHPWLTMPVLL